MWVKNYSEELYHHGIKGQRWGVRRFQNEDGSLTPAGKKRQAKLEKKLEKKYAKAGDAAGRAAYHKSKGDEAAKQYDDNAKVLNRAAAQYEKEGKILRAEAARRLAKRQTEKGLKARENYDLVAEAYLEQSKYYNKKANKFATKKNIDLGKERVNSILKKFKQKGFDAEKRDEEIDNLFREREKEWEAERKQSDAEWEALKNKYKK